MKIADIPFNRHPALEPCGEEKGVMRLKSSPEMTNHLGTIHASGQFLLGMFPEHSDDYVAVLRKSQVKYKDQTMENVYAPTGAGLMAGGLPWWHAAKSPF